MEHESLLPCSQHPPASILCQMNPVFTLQTYFPNIHFELILLPTLYLVYSYTLLFILFIYFSLFNDACSVTQTA
jgi:hypothetical protein